jgi:hypothetical protein
VLADQDIPVIMYDHTIDMTPYEHPYFIFYKLGWGVQTENEFLSLSDIKKNPLCLKAQHKILKFDIEGGEFDIFRTLDVDELEDFEVITFEVHWLERLNEDDFYNDTLIMFQKLNKNHIPIWIHANNFGRIVIVEGIAFPQVIEMTFMRKDLDLFSHLSNEPIPGPYDMPNCPHWPDIIMNLF